MPDRPRPGDKVYKPGLRQSNGFVLRVLRHEDEVYCKFYDTDERITFQIDEFEGRWTRKYGGLWYLDRD